MSVYAFPRAVYHHTCVDVWLKNYKDECPNCKTSITANKKKKKKGSQTSSEQSPLLAARDDDDDEAAVDYGSARREDGLEEEEDAQTGQLRLTAHEPEGREEESGHAQAHVSSSSGPNDASTELRI